MKKISLLPLIFLHFALPACVTLPAALGPGRTFVQIQLWKEVQDFLDWDYEKVCVFCRERISLNVQYVNLRIVFQLYTFCSRIKLAPIKFLVMRFKLIS